MNFNILKHVGRAIASGRALLPIAGVIASVTKSGRDDRIVNVVNDSFGEIENVLALAEAVGEIRGDSGLMKLTTATPMVASIILKSAIMVGREVEDSGKFSSGCSDLASAIVKIVNSLRPATGSELAEIERRKRAGDSRAMDYDQI